MTCTCGNTIPYGRRTWCSQRCRNLHDCKLYNHKRKNMPQRLHKMLAIELDEYVTYPIAVVYEDGHEVKGTLTQVTNDTVTVRHNNGVLKDYPLEGDIDFRPMTRI